MSQTKCVVVPGKLIIFYQPNVTVYEPPKHRCTFITQELIKALNFHRSIPVVPPHPHLHCRHLHTNFGNKNLYLKRLM